MDIGDRFVTASDEEWQIVALLPELGQVDAMNTRGQRKNFWQAQANERRDNGRTSQRVR